jgi:hypothetical protein
MSIFYFSSFHSNTKLLGGSSGRQLELLRVIRASSDTVLFYCSSHSHDVPEDCNIIFYLSYLQRIIPPPVFNYLSPRIFPGARLALLVLYLFTTSQLKRGDKLFVYNQIGLPSLVIYPFLRICGISVLQHLCELHDCSDYKGSILPSLNERINILSLYISQASFVCMSPAFQRLPLLRTLNSLFLPSLPPAPTHSISVVNSSELFLQLNRILVVTNGAPRDDIPYIAAEVSRLRQRADLILLGLNKRFLAQIHHQMQPYASIIKTTILSDISAERYVDTLRSSSIVVLPRGTHRSLNFCFPSRICDILRYANGSLIVGKNLPLSDYLDMLGTHYYFYTSSVSGSFLDAVQQCKGGNQRIVLSQFASQSLTERLLNDFHCFLSQA